MNLYFNHKKKSRGKKRFNYLENYPNIIVSDTEDLNLEHMYIRELAKMWNNIQKYPTILDVSKNSIWSERSIYRLINKYKFPKNREEKIIIENLIPS